MTNGHGPVFRRTDMWREGKWLDLWSVVHLLSGISTGLGLYFLHFDAIAATLLSLLAFISYEMWEALVHIDEHFTNRFTDVVVGFVGFAPAFFFFAPPLTFIQIFIAFVVIFTADIAMSIVGWRASQKAAMLKKRVQAQYALRRARLLKRSSRLKQKLGGK